MLLSEEKVTCALMNALKIINEAVWGLTKKQLLRCCVLGETKQEKEPALRKNWGQTTQKGFSSFHEPFGSRGTSKRLLKTVPFELTWKKWVFKTLLDAKILLRIVATSASRHIQVAGPERHCQPRQGHHAGNTWQHAGGGKAAQAWRQGEKNIPHARAHSCSPRGGCTCLGPRAAAGRPALLCQSAARKSHTSVLLAGRALYQARRRHFGHKGSIVAS